MQNLLEYKGIIHELNIAEQAMNKAIEEARRIGYPAKELEITANKISYISSRVQFVSEVKEQEGR